MNTNAMTRDISFYQQKAVYVSPYHGLATMRNDMETLYSHAYPCGTAKCYNSNNGVYYWQDLSGGYVLPYFEGIIDVLCQAGYVANINLYVPCSNGDVPEYMEAYWYRLLQESALDRRNASLDFTLALAGEKGIAPLPEEFLANFCVEIPLSGVKAESWSGTHRIFPHVTSTWPAEELKAIIGTYYHNNGVIAFVDEYARTWVTFYFNGKTNDVLSHAGYTEYGIFVPFSNGETPTEPAFVRHQWDHLQKLK